MKIKVSKHKVNIHSMRFSESKSNSGTRVATYVMHIPNTLGKKQQQAKIPIAFLFSQLHLNNVTSHALFYGGHLVMRSKRCALQNQEITSIKNCKLWMFGKNLIIFRSVLEKQLQYVVLSPDEQDINEYFLILGE